MVNAGQNLPVQAVADPTAPINSLILLDFIAPRGWQASGMDARRE
jgi:hypothetical protein